MNLKFVLATLLSIQIFSLLFAQNSNCVTAINNLNQDSLVSQLLKLIGKKQVIINDTNALITSRYAYHPGNLLAENYLFDECKKLGYEVFKNPFNKYGTNIVAFKNGTKTSKEVVMICAHYDCVGTVNKPFQGADDNASGCAAVLEAARVLKDLDLPFTIAFAFWDEEEFGLLGSAAFAPMGPYEWFIKAVINLDMIAYDSNNDGLTNIHVYPTQASIDLGAQIKACNTLYNIGLNPVIINPGTRQSDNFSFSTRNITANAITEDYDIDFNPNWHLPSDSFENCNIPYFYKITHLATSAMCHLAANYDNTSFHEPNFKHQISITYNQDLNTFSLNGIEATSETKIQIMNLQGTIMQETDFSQKPIALNEKIHNGLYIIIIANKTETTLKKLLVYR